MLLFFIIFSGFFDALIPSYQSFLVLTLLYFLVFLITDTIVIDG